MWVGGFVYQHSEHAEHPKQRVFRVFIAEHHLVLWVRSIEAHNGQHMLSTNLLAHQYTRCEHTTAHSLLTHPCTCCGHTTAHNAALPA